MSAITQCQAEVTRLVARGTSGSRSGSRQTNTYEQGRCTRQAVEHVAMYPPRDEPNAMHPTAGAACRQHAEMRLPRKAVGA